MDSRVRIISNLYDLLDVERCLTRFEKEHLNETYFTELISKLVILLRRFQLAGNQSYVEDPFCYSVRHVVEIAKRKLFLVAPVMLTVNMSPEYSYVGGVEAWVGFLDRGVRNDPIVKNEDPFFGEPNLEKIR